MCKIKEGYVDVYLGLSEDTHNAPLDKYIIKVHIKNYCYYIMLTVINTN